MKVLFLTWDGPQVSYLESLFLPIFAGLADHGVAFHVVQFTWGDRERRETSAKACRAKGVPYTSIQIHRGAGPAGYLLTMLTGIRRVRRYLLKNNISVVMPRGTLMGTVARASRKHGMRLVVDADGFPWDLKVEFRRIKSSGVVYRLLRDLEAQVIRSADRVICRTDFARCAIIARAGGTFRDETVSVVSNGRDSNRFRVQNEGELAEIRKNLSIPEDAPVICYAGSLGGPYCLPEMAEFFRLASEHRSDARFLVLTTQQDFAAELTKLCGSNGERVIVRSLDPNDVPLYLGLASLGLNFRAATFSMRSVAPVKVGEYLLCGVPALTTHTAVNPADDPDGKAMRVIESLSPDVLKASVDWYCDEVLARHADIRDSARRLGLRHFSLETSVIQYATVLQSLPEFRSVKSQAEQGTAPARQRAWGP